MCVRAEPQIVGFDSVPALKPYGRRPAAPVARRKLAHITLGLVARASI